MTFQRSLTTPDYHFYEVTQIRTVRVKATNTADAGRIAKAAFDDSAEENTNPTASYRIAEVNGCTMAEVKETGLNVTRDMRV